MNSDDEHKGSQHQTGAKNECIDEVTLIGSVSILFSPLSIYISARGFEERKNVHSFQDSLLLFTRSTISQSFIHFFLGTTEPVQKIIVGFKEFSSHIRPQRTILVDTSDW